MTATLKQNIQKGIREMLKKYTNCKADNIVCGYNNRVPLPDNNDYIIFTILNPFRDCTPVVTYSSNGLKSEQDYRVTVQIDFYGDLAFDRANAIMNIARTEFLCDFLKQYSIQPISCDEAKNLTGISGEMEYVERWSVDFEIDYQDAVIDNQDWFNTAELNILETEL